MYFFQTEKLERHLHAEPDKIFRGDVKGISRDVHSPYRRGLNGSFRLNKQIQDLM